MTDDRASLSLEQVVQRFSESERGLRELASTIQKLGRLQEDTKASTRALNRATEAINLFVDEAQTVTKELAATSQAARDLLEKASEVLDGSQLERIESLLGDTTEGLAEVRSEQAERFANLSTSVSTVGKAVQDAKLELATELDHSEDLEILKESIDETQSSVTETGSKFVTELQKRLRSAEENISGAAKRNTWLLVGVVLLQAVLLGWTLLGGS